MSTQKLTVTITGVQTGDKVEEAGFRLNAMVMHKVKCAIERFFSGYKADEVDQMPGKINLDIVGKVKVISCHETGQEIFSVSEINHVKVNDNDHALEVYYEAFGE